MLQERLQTINKNTTIVLLIAVVVIVTLAVGAVQEGLPTLRGSEAGLNSAVIRSSDTASETVAASEINAADMKFYSSVTGPDAADRRFYFDPVVVENVSSMMIDPADLKFYIEIR